MARTTKKGGQKAPRVDVAQMVTDRMIESLEKGTIPWQRTWRTIDHMPKSLSTGKPYRGINVFLLTITAAIEGYDAPWWGTYRQITERGGQVRKGEHGTQVVLWKFLEKAGTDRNGEPTVKKIPWLTTFVVFNQDQADWPEGSRKPKPDEQPTGPSEAPVEAAEALVAGYLATGPSLKHGGDRAFYRPATDEVHMPQFEAFGSAAAYHSTLFHELTHSTGNSKRLDRPGVADGTFGKFGDAVYSAEELVAEMGAAMLCAHAGIDQDAVFGNSASYIQSWLSVLKGDKDIVIKAASQATKAVDTVLGIKAQANGEKEAA
jgi:antirestriction protein ArdC